MVLAAGRGERMRPLSDTLPKPALPLPDGPVVRSALQLAATTGTGRVVVNVWHLAERMEGCLSAIHLPGVTAVGVARAAPDGHRRRSRARP